MIASLVLIVLGESNQLVLNYLSSLGDVNQIDFTYLSSSCYKIRWSDSVKYGAVDLHAEEK